MQNKFTVSSDENKLLNYIRSYYKNRELFPSIESIKRNLNISNTELTQQLRNLEKSGSIDKRLSQYYINENTEKIETPVKKEIKQIEKPIEKKEIEQKEEIEKEQPINIKEKKNNQVQETKTNDNKFDKIKLFILKFGMGFVGLIATFLSIFYTFLWFKNILNFFFSLISSLFIVIFSILSFEYMILFKKDKRYSLIFLFAILWFIAVSFSMSSTLAGQLQLEFQKIIAEDSEQLKDNNDVTLFKEYVYQIEDYEQDLKGKRKEIDKLRDLLYMTSYDTTADRKKYNDLNYRITIKDQEIKELKIKIETLQNKKEELLKNNVKVNVRQKIDFFDWLESLFKIRSDVFKFILYLFPALFIDLAAPICLSIVFFYKRRKYD